MSKDLTEGLPRSLDENSLPTLEATFTTNFRKAKTDRFRKWSNPQRTGIESIPANRLTFQGLGNIFSDNSNFRESHHVLTICFRDCIK